MSKFYMEINCAQCEINKAGNVECCFRTCHNNKNGMSNDYTWMMFDCDSEEARSKAVTELNKVFGASCEKRYAIETVEEYLKNNPEIKEHGK